TFLWNCLNICLITQNVVTPFTNRGRVCEQGTISLGVDSMTEVSRRRISKALLLGAVVGLTIGMSNTGAQAMSLQEAIQLVVTTNPTVGEQVKNRRSIDHELRQARGLYLPQIDAQFNAGPEFSENGGVDRPDAALDQ